jgi:ubiquinone/menaquinone biosynthesis C-methylase UbiE
LRNGRNEIIVDLRNLSLDGDVLDMGAESRGIIYRALKSMPREACDEAAVTIDPKADIEDCSWVYGYPSELPFEESRFDAVTSFFSLHKLKRKNVRNKALKEITRTLKVGGRLLLWDININMLSFGLKRKVKALLASNETVRLEIIQSGRSGSYNMDAVLPVIGQYFSNIRSKNYGKYFYIEAEKKGMESDE